MSRRILWNYFKSILKQPFYKLYEKRLGSKAFSWNLPKHIGIIMDGNRRFAQQSGLLKVVDGHSIGANKLMEVVNWSYDVGIPVITVWSFSLENFQRDSEEVQSLFELFEAKTLELIQHEDIKKKNIRVRYIGKLDMLPDSLQKAISAVQTATAHYKKCTLNIAMAYGGREEITDGFKSFLLNQNIEGYSLDEAIDHLDSNSIEPYLYTSGLPEPDLIIRTSGEVRLSGFLLWQSVHSEFYFCDTFWPAFRKIDFLRALRSYDQRQRRFGR
jgi:short-chain Z-isoprenyl diphosphate synthase